MNSKKTKGRQKINIKKIEREEDRLVTLSKRKNGIYKKLCELSVLCDVNVAFLGYTGSGKPYTFGSPSFHAVAEQFLNGEASSSSSSLQRPVDRNYKAKIQYLCELYNNMIDAVRAEEAKATKAAASMEPLPEDAWWKVPPAEVKDQEEMKQYLERFEGLYEKLSYELAARSGRNDTAEKDK
ncbi:hypothetical protein CARUB_v10012214mg [Capsella rubella]|uniref:MADS-box domain-containing protein n=1 Tax=Capsella rubella TaxID=81985 RepID=R0IL01_9BRAS|nr:agamous-like MADS-box protein AGL29 [Capsella rubella]EOA39235.1 hypothetical protein CARUB_v10012214mg [Capsella rubella]